jgi:hypothetical protein
MIDTSEPLSKKTEVAMIAVDCGFGTCVETHQTMVKQTILGMNRPQQTCRCEHAVTALCGWWPRLEAPGQPRRWYGRAP